MTGCEETMCTYCAHLEVCSKKEQYLNTLKAINNCDIYENAGDGNTRISKLRDFDWIKVSVDCKHYIMHKGVTIR